MNKMRLQFPALSIASALTLSVLASFQAYATTDDEMDESSSSTSFDSPTQTQSGPNSESKEEISDLDTIIGRLEDLIDQAHEANITSVASVSREDRSQYIDKKCSSFVNDVKLISIPKSAGSEEAIFESYSRYKGEARAEIERNYGVNAKSQDAMLDYSTLVFNSVIKLTVRIKKNLEADRAKLQAIESRNRETMEKDLERSKAFITQIRKSPNRQVRDAVEKTSQELERLDEISRGLERLELGGTRNPAEGHSSRRLFHSKEEKVSS